MRSLSFVLLAALATPAIAQNRPNDAAVQRAVSTITEADYRARIGVLAHDSMRGRGTPSPELEEVAQWIAAEFRRFGLRPGGDSGTFFQRYRMTRQRTDTTQSFVMLMGPGGHAHWQVGRDAHYFNTFGGSIPTEAITGPVVLMAGPVADTARPFNGVPQGAIVMIVPTRAGGATQHLNRAAEAGVKGIILLVNPPRAQFANQMANALRNTQLTLVGPAENTGVPLFMIHDSTAMPTLRALNEDVTALRAGTNGGVRPLQGLTAQLSIQRPVVGEETAPNVIGVLEGSDPQLRNEYVFFTAHMDHVGAIGMGNGCGRNQTAPADSICNGADDDASGTTGVIQLAHAFSRMNPRPRRSMVFMLVSGEERGLWGSEHYSNHPTLPLENTVAAINLDMIGRNWRDTISVIGKEHSSLGATANRINQQHPELGMSLVDDLWPTENFYFRSDHFNFARKGVPILFFFNGVHQQYHQVTDHVDMIDAEKATRIVKMVFHIGLDVSNTTERPQWNPESRARIVQ